eukprot:m.14672 g.14672  ORF g.14672 m.14672 type:complete len:277 (-) comp5181_c0_seq1:168-998(-)
MPKYADLDKSTKDLLKDDFDIGDVKLTYELKSASGLGFKFEGKKNNDTNAIPFSTESTITSASGITFKETFSSKGTVAIEASAKNKITKGTKLVGEATFTTKGDFSGALAKAEYAKGGIHLDSKAVLGKSISAGGVFNYGKFLLGASLVSSSSDKNPLTYEAAVAYNDTNLSICSKAINGSALEASVFHKYTPKVDCGLKVNFAPAKDSLTATIGASIKNSDGSTCKFKFNTNQDLGLAHVRMLSPGVKLGLACNVNIVKPASDAHVLGMSLKFSA